MHGIRVSRLSASMCVYVCEEIEANFFSPTDEGKGHIKTMFLSDYNFLQFPMFTRKLRAPAAKKNGSIYGIDMVLLRP